MTDLPAANQPAPEAAREFAKEVRSYVTDYIKVCDAKAGAVFTAIGLIGAVLSSLADKTLRLAADHGPRFKLVSEAVLVVAALGIVLAVCFTIRTLLPRTPKAQGSLASFPDIARVLQAPYVEQVGKLDEHAVAAEYALHAWTLSNIAMAKFAALRWALRFLTVAVLATLMFAAIHVWTETERDQKTTSVRVLPQPARTAKSSCQPS